LQARPERTREGRRELAGLSAVLLLALALRLGWALLVAGDPHSAPNYDGAWYERVARDLLAGVGVRGVDGQPTAFFPPGYPALLASAYAVFGTHAAVAKVLNALLATLSCLFAWGAGRAAYGPRVGLVAALLLAASPGDVFYAGLTLSEPAFACALTGLVFAFLVWTRADASLPRWLLFGLLLGAASLVRGIALLFPAVLLAAWLAAQGSTRRTWLRFACVAAGTALAVAPWTLRNHVRLGSPILIASDGPNALLIAHWPGADGSQSLDVWDFRLREYAELASLQNPRKEAEFARADLRYALGWMLSHPREELRLVPRRLFHTFKHDHYALQLTTRTRVDPATGERRTQLRWGLGPGGTALTNPRSLLGLARFADAAFFALVLFAALGATRVFSRGARAGLVVPGSLLFFLAAHGVLFWGDVRFHAPFVPMLAILAAVAIDGRRRPWAIQPGEAAR
jgi:4-amino-4-deoxy-L-arabinose transferase-like glycosyltransferase